MRNPLGGFVLASLLVATVAVAQQRPAAQAPAAPAPAAAGKAPARQAGEPKPLVAAAKAEVDSGVIVYREFYAYDRGGRRDPFASLMSTPGIRPALHELKLTGVLVHPTRPVAVMRDKKNVQYRVTTGMSIGRARVVSIEPGKVIFAITQYGHERRDSLFLGDTVTKRP